MRVVEYRVEQNVVLPPTLERLRISDEDSERLAELFAEDPIEQWRTDPLRLMRFFHTFSARNVREGIASWLWNAASLLDNLADLTSP